MSRRGAEDDFEVPWAEDPRGDLQFDEPDPPTRPGRVLRRPAWLGAAAWVGAAVVLVLGGVLLVPPAPPDLTAFRIVPDLSEPPRILWRTTTSGELDDHRVWVLGGAPVLADDSGVRGFAPSTGALRWEVRTPHPRCNVAHVVVCVAREDGTTRVLTIDPDDGSVERRDAPGVVAATVVGEDLLELRSSDAGYDVVRTSAGEDLWSTPVGAFEAAALAATVPMLVAHEQLVVDLPAGAVLDVVTGESLYGFVDVAVFPGDRWQVRADFERTYRLLAADGTEIPQRNEYAETPYIDDAPDADTWFVRTPLDDSVRARSLRSGGTIWRARPGEFPLARMGELIVFWSEPALVGVDARTGERLWEVAPSADLFGWPFYADGTYLMASDVSTDGAVSVTGIDTRSGEVAWQVPTGPDPVVVVDDATDGRHAFVVTETELVALRLG